MSTEIKELDREIQHVQKDVVRLAKLEKECTELAERYSEIEEVVVPAVARASRSTSRYLERLIKRRADL